MDIDTLTISTTQPDPMVVPDAEQIRIWRQELGLPEHLMRDLVVAPALNHPRWYDGGLD